MARDNAEVVTRMVQEDPETLVSTADTSTQDSSRVHLESRLAPSQSVLNGYPETGSEGESLTTPSESVASGPTP